MKLKALDQVHVSSVQADSLRPGQVFVVSDDAGAELLKIHPTKFEAVADDDADAGAAAAEAAPAEKAEPEPQNKAAPPAANKAAPKAAKPKAAKK